VYYAQKGIYPGRVYHRVYNGGMEVYHRVYNGGMGGIPGGVYPAMYTLGIPGGVYQAMYTLTYTTLGMPPSHPGTLSVMLSVLPVRPSTGGEALGSKKEKPMGGKRKEA